MPDQPVRVLLVEDDEDDYVLTRALLTEGFGARLLVDWASTRAIGLTKLLDGEFDVALVDYHLGGETGIDLLRAARARGSRTPVIMLTGQSDRATDLNAMHAGAADYLVKGRVTGDMLERAIRYARERHRLLEEISALSLTDELTGLHNRRAFLTMADQRLQLLERTGSQCLLVFADVDGLKWTNDTVGHEAGDRLLVDAARVLQGAFRRTDLVARLGGDEFVVLADDATDADVHLVLGKLQEQIDLRNTAAGTAVPRLSISAGALCFQAGAAIKLQDLLAEADARMLQNKAGRRRASGAQVAVS
ncbi:MAG TPA: GGDEF domain-containing response regulator [Gemmatimonadaceae bacterium]|jgi:diguanylate cyclase (GGDEF)-like protein|nr:GGDEF domain-containing response regulator [Gemmatimonadaceae bacterium]